MSLELLVEVHNRYVSYVLCRQLVALRCETLIIYVLFELCRQIFKKSSNIKFHEYPFGGSRVVPFRHTDRQILRN